MKSKMRNFFTRNVHDRRGFTLVELIVVIAVLAILAGVAVPAYSGYVTKANKQADMTLVSDIKNALTLAYYSGDFSGGYVILSAGDPPQCSDDSVKAAMAATYGEDWGTRNDLNLKYDGWSATFQSSNYYGDSDGLTTLLGTVDGLTDALGAALANSTIANEMAGGNFDAYAAELSIKSTDENYNAKLADAAVFYVADVTGGVSNESLQKAAKDMIDEYQQSATSSGTNSSTPDDYLAIMNGATNSTLASTATLYALAYGFAQSCKETQYTFESDSSEQKTMSQYLQSVTDGFTGTDESGNKKTTIANAADAFTKLMTAFGKMASVNQSGFESYMNSAMTDDLNAYADAMRTVSAAKNNILNDTSNTNSLGSANYFSSTYITSLLTNFSNGNVFVFASVDADGNLLVSSSIDTQ